MGCIAFTVVALVLGLFGGGVGILVGFFAGVVSFPFWIAGLFVVGWPVWKVLEQRGRRDLKAAQISGALAAMVSAPLASWALFTNMSFAVGIYGALALAVVAIPSAAGGVASGWTFWHLYGQVHAS
jgi:ABC-type antimicrobial peptide transport system permease subunit